MASTTRTPEFDCIVLAGLCSDASDVAGAEFRKHGMLYVDSYQASIPFLREYFRMHRDAGKAAEAAHHTQEKMMTLAGPYLQQFLQRAGYKTALVPHMEPGYFQEIKDLLLRGTKYVIISTSFVYATELLAMVAGFVKQIAPEVTIIAGGIFIYKSYRVKLLVDQGEYNMDYIQTYDSETQQLFMYDKHLPVDIYVVNIRGENTLLQVLAKLNANQPWNTLDNLAWYENGWHFSNIQEEPYAPMVMDWSRVVTNDCRCFLPVQVAQGCPFQCMFCDFGDLHSKNFRHSIESVLAVCATVPLVDGYRRIFFTDDNLFMTKKSAKEICQMFIESGLHLRWQSFLRANSIDDEVAELMAKSGCIKVLIGVESGHDDQQRRIGKYIGRSHLLSALSALNRNGISTFMTFLCGFPGECAETVQATIDVLNDVPCDGPAVNEYCVFKFAALPLSRISLPKNRARYNLQGGFLTWKHDTMNSDEVGAYLNQIATSVKVQVTPHYGDESYFLEDPFLTMEQHKQVVQLRNKIMRVREGRLTEDEGRLWDELEAVFVASGGRTSPPPMLPPSGSPDPVVEEAPVSTDSASAAPPGGKRYMRLKPKELQMLMADPSVALKIKKDPLVWKKIRKPRTLGKLMQAALDPSRYERDPQLAALVERLKELTGIGL